MAPYKQMVFDGHFCLRKSSFYPQMFVVFHTLGARETQGKHKGNTRETQGKHKGNTRETQGKHKGNTGGKENRGKNRGKNRGTINHEQLRGNQYDDVFATNRAHMLDAGGIEGGACTYPCGYCCCGSCAYARPNTLACFG
jgi:hypothetical protein